MKLFHKKYIAILYVAIITVVLLIPAFIYMDYRNETPLLCSDIETITTKPDTMNYLDITVIVTVLTALGIIISNIFNPLNAKRHQIVINKIEALDKNNQEQHNVIFNKITKTENIVKVVTDRQTVAGSLRIIINNSLVYCQDKKLAEFISDEGINMIDFCSELLDIGISKIEEPHLTARIDSIISSIKPTLIIKFNDEFANKVNNKIAKLICLYKNDILKISTDSLMNSKLDRFRMRSEQFLQEYLSYVIISFTKQQIK